MKSATTRCRLPVNVASNTYRYIWQIITKYSSRNALPWDCTLLCQVLYRLRPIGWTGFNYIHVFKNASTTSNVRIHLLSLLFTNFMQHKKATKRKSTTRFPLAKIKRSHCTWLPTSICLKRMDKIAQSGNTWRKTTSRLSHLEKTTSSGLYLLPDFSSNVMKVECTNITVSLFTQMCLMWSMLCCTTHSKPRQRRVWCFCQCESLRHPSLHIKPPTSPICAAVRADSGRPLSCGILIHGCRGFSWAACPDWFCSTFYAEIPVSFGSSHVANP